MKQPVVGVVFGSRSAEHDVSIITALASIIKPLALSGEYQVVPVYITKGGLWYCHPDLADIRLFSSGEIDGWLRRHRPMLLSFDPASQALTLADCSGYRQKRIRLDVVFPALHGTHGEDGEVMGVLGLAGVPYVGCGLAASAVAMDKVLTKLAAKGAGIAVTKFEHFTKQQYEADPDEWVTRVNRTLRYPLFVKPAHLGSSIGISRVAEPKDLRDAIEVALHYDDKALVEEAVSNLIEVTLPIIGNDTPRPALLEQPLLRAEDFFDFDTKYMHGGKKGGQKGGADGAGGITGAAKGAARGSQGYSRLPADLPDDLYVRAEATGLAAYRALGCGGIARVDMLIDGTEGIVYCNEVNPLPGSLYAHNWAQAGVSNVALVTELVRLALERHNQAASLETSFATNYLKQF